MRPTDPPRPAGPWAPYQPDDQAPWDLRRVVHLHRRAGFAATWEEVQRDLKDGPEKSVGRLLAGQARLTGVPAAFDSTANLLGDAAVAANDPARLKAWWIYRMMFGPDPLGERLTLMWHDHFATSNLKVEDLGAMRRQNELLRRHARAPFGELLTDAVRDPALLVFLDAPANRKGHANENLARELMELFTLGIGNYTEADVKEAARTLTGWSVEEGAFTEKPKSHDDGDKTVLGRAGKWTCRDLVPMLLDHPATAKRLAFKVCRLFFGEGVADAAAVQALAEGLRQHKLDVGWAAGTVLRSRAFFAEANLGTRVAEPVGFVVGVSRALEMFEPAPSTLVLADWAARLGQDLFYPPNVGGWPGGRSWVSTRAVVGRANFVAALLSGPGAGRPVPYDAAGLSRRHGRGSDPEGVWTFHAELLRGTAPTPGERDRLRAALSVAPSDDGDTARRAVALLLTAPEALLS
jgi:uncharacterized protein (DUF1800 family)